MLELKSVLFGSRGRWLLALALLLSLVLNAQTRVIRRRLHEQEEEEEGGDEDQDEGENGEEFGDDGEDGMDEPEYEEDGEEWGNILLLVVGPSETAKYL